MRAKNEMTKDEVVEKLVRRVERERSAAHAHGDYLADVRHLLESVTDLVLAMHGKGVLEGGEFMGCRIVNEKRPEPAGEKPLTVAEVLAVAPLPEPEFSAPPPDAGKLLELCAQVPWDWAILQLEADELDEQADACRKIQEILKTKAPSVGQVSGSRTVLD